MFEPTTVKMQELSTGGPYPGFPVVARYICSRAKYDIDKPLESISMINGSLLFRKKEKVSLDLNSEAASS